MPQCIWTVRRNFILWPDAHRASRPKVGFVRLAKLFAAAWLAITYGLGSHHAHATDAGVDVALVIAGDVSGSMVPDELRLQRDGFAAAFRHPDVLNVIGSGMTGRIAVTYIEWAGPTEQRIIAPWTIISNRADADAFAALLSAAAPISGGGTSLSSGMVFAAAQFRTLGTTTKRQTIDISGDSFNSTGPALAPAREFVLGMGITINGLTFPMSAVHYPPNYGNMPSGSAFDLVRYYEDCVIGGAGGFVMNVKEPAQFISVIRRKVALEIAALPANVEYADFRVDAGRARNCVDFDAR